VHRVNGTIKHDQAGTLRLQRGNDAGTTWTTVHELAMAGGATEADAFDFYIAPYYMWRLVWVNGGVDQTVWFPDITLSSEASPTQT
jgi:hypothetical protein